MKYNVLEDFPLNVGKAEPITVKAGVVFVPAATNVPQNEVDALVKSGKIELIKPASTAATAKRK